jgi:hypothetical protein
VNDFLEWTPGVFSRSRVGVYPCLASAELFVGEDYNANCSSKSRTLIDESAAQHQRHQIQVEDGLEDSRIAEQIMVSVQNHQFNPTLDCNHISARAVNSSLYFS